MSDRRPENPTELRVHHPPCGPVCEGRRVASPADLIVAVRRGVESGTIKGEVVGWCDTHNQRANMVIEKPACYHRLGCQVSHRLVLPDGGEK